LLSGGRSATFACAKAQEALSGGLPLAFARAKGRGSKEDFAFVFMPIAVVFIRIFIRIQIRTALRRRRTFARAKGR
jgi:hypothetical protein